MLEIQIEVVGKDTIKEREMLELIQGNLINCGVTDHIKINYGLAPDDTRKYISFPANRKLMDFLRKHSVATQIQQSRTESKPA